MAEKRKALPEKYGEHVAATNAALDVDDTVVLLPRPLMKYGSTYLIEKHRWTITISVSSSSRC